MDCGFCGCTNESSTSILGNAGPFGVTEYIETYAFAFLRCRLDHEGHNAAERFYIAAEQENSQGILRARFNLYSGR